MPSRTAKHIWVFLSAYGIFFAIFSFSQEILTKGLFIKGSAAIIFGFALYRLVVNRI